MFYVHLMVPKSFMFIIVLLFIKYIKLFIRISSQAWLWSFILDSSEYSTETGRVNVWEGKSELDCGEKLRQFCYILESQDKPNDWFFLGAGSVTCLKVE